MSSRSHSESLRQVCMWGCWLMAWASILPAGLAPLRAAEPVDPELIPEARAVLNYLESIYGKQTLCGQSTGAGLKRELTGAEALFKATGKYPAIVSLDLTGWNSPTWGPSYREVLQRQVDGAKMWWQERRGLVTMQWHWHNPLRADGSAWVRPPKGTGPVDLSRMLTPGTVEHRAAMEDLRKTGLYLQQLAEARVPVLIRPLHEIDGGWFWWTDVDHPENSAALYRMVFDCFVKRRQLHNLIWVYSASVRKMPVEERKRFYPGPQYVDIAGIDIYSNQAGLDYRKQAYSSYYDQLQQVATGKMLALTECDAIPEPDIMTREGPRWLYCLTWFKPGTYNPPEWARYTCHHEFVITLDELPPVARSLIPWNGTLPAR